MVFNKKTKAQQEEENKASARVKPPAGFPVQVPRGTQDILPQEQKYWEYVVETAKAVARGFGWQRIDTPMFEETILFTRGVGEETDIVSKELFELKRRGGSSQYALRPEGTSAVARAYIEHGMRSWPKPVKLFYVGPYFRYDRPQAGRWRQFHQIGLEVFGSSAPITDAQVIYVTNLMFGELGIEDYVLKINSIGGPGERKEYIKVLRDHYRRNRKKMCRLCAERLKTNPLRVLDCKEEKCQQLANTAPRLLDHLTDVSKQYFESVLKSLDALEVKYEVAPSLVRGLDYYTHTVFEFVAKKREDVAQNTLAGGGRYDGLVRALGGRDTPGTGVSIGVERVIDQLKAEEVELTVTDAPQLFIAHLGELAKNQSLRIMRDLQVAGIPFAESIHRDGMQAQLKAADRLRVQSALIIGHKEVIDKTVILRNMESGMQEVIPQEKLIEELQRRLHIQNGG
ncbi:MAG: histidine--tRNA ligase [Candidatus Andersenbacteria bacterium]|nr:histidine--tRNA ligase [bacterium]MDZ4225379.1 histidine--tRNA ligase [Candidatus Andersenbacteria bacterium]